MLFNFIKKKNREPKEDNNDTYSEKLKRHKQNRIMTIVVIVIVCVIIICATALFLKNKNYDNYTVLVSNERTDMLDEQYRLFNNNILKYSQDGIEYMDTNFNPIWSQAYDFNESLIDCSNEYTAVAQKAGNIIYIMDTDSIITSIDTGMKISQIRVSGVGTVLAVLEDKDINYLKYYDTSGDVIAEGTVKMKKSGYPIDYDLSDDGTKMVMSYIYISNGIMKTNVAFYNFGTVGQSELDNLVSSYSYDNCIIPNVEFIGNNKIIGFGDKSIYIYEGSEKPEESQTISIDTEINSILLDKDYFGIVYDSSDEAKQIIDIYKMSGNKASSFVIDIKYNNIALYANQIIAYNDNECRAYSINGREHFTYKFNSTLENVIPISAYNQYIVVSQKSVEKIKLK